MPLKPVSHRTFTAMHHTLVWWDFWTFLEDVFYLMIKFLKKYIRLEVMKPICESGITVSFWFWLALLASVWAVFWFKKKTFLTDLYIHTHTHIYIYIYEVHTLSFQTFFVWAFKIVVDSWKFSILSSVSSTEKDIDTRLTKAWTAIDRLSIIWKSDLTDKMKRSFFQAAVVSILLYECTTWTLTKRLEKKLDRNYKRMLRAVLNKSWRQHPTRHQLYGHLPPITKTIQVRRTRHTGHCLRSKDELISDVLLWTPTYGRAKAGRPARTYIQQLCEDTGCNPEDLSEAMNNREKWLGLERGLGISVLAARHDDDDDCYTSYEMTDQFLWFQLQMNSYSKNCNTPY